MPWEDGKGRRRGPDATVYVVVAAGIARVGGFDKHFGVGERGIA
jgi:hypothetical protein